ncbi:MAG: hypothetical protein WDO19_11425 [Bacteroidota bacterium]
MRPNQKDSDSLPEYDILDRVLNEYIELRNGPKEIIAKGFNPAFSSKGIENSLISMNINETNFVLLYG